MDAGAPGESGARANHKPHAGILLWRLGRYQRTFRSGSELAARCGRCSRHANPIANAFHQPLPFRLHPAYRGAARLRPRSPERKVIAALSHRGPPERLTQPVLLADPARYAPRPRRSEEYTSELQSL